MGFVSDQQGIYNRYSNEDGGWISHLENSKKYITKFIENSKGNVAVLGSGWLLDIPIARLCDQFEKVYLVDIFHPAQIKQLIKKFSNVELISVDITGGLIESVYYEIIKSQKNKSKPDLQKIEIPDFKLNFTFDSIISVTILNQLDTLIIEHLNKHFVLDENIITEFRRSIQQKHLDYLGNYHSCLITDFEEWLFDPITNKIETKNLLYCEVPTNENSRNWDWLFDMKGNYKKGKKTILKIMATTLK